MSECGMTALAGLAGWPMAPFSEMWKTKEKWVSGASKKQ